MTALEVGKQLVALIRAGRSMDVFNQLYAQDVTTSEATDWPTFPRETRGIEVVREKNRWWYENFEMHSMEVEGPFPNGDQFIALFRMDMTEKATSKRIRLTSAGLYTVARSKVVREQFFYELGGSQ